MKVNENYIVVAEKEGAILIVTQKVASNNEISLMSKGVIVSFENNKISDEMQIGTLLNGGYWKEILPRKVTEKEKKIIENI